MQENPSLLSFVKHLEVSSAISAPSAQRRTISDLVSSSPEMQIPTVIRQFMQMDSNVLPGLFTRLNSDRSLILLRLPKTTPTNFDEVHQDELIPADAALFRHSLER
jgi:hypothetical protein